MRDWCQPEMNPTCGGDVTTTREEAEDTAQQWRTTLLVNRLVPVKQAG